VKRVLFYLFFDEQGIVDDYIPYKLSKLREDVDTIFVVSNSPLDERARGALEAVADVVYVRENVGFDVWGYKEAMEVFGEKRLEEYDELILMNYTFFGPIYPFSETFAAMDASDCDFWGITAHKAMTPNPFTGEGVLPLHLNSHWIAVRRKMFMSKEFRQYWATMPPITSYVDSVLQHESRFTEHFKNKGFSCIVTFPAENYPTEYTAFQSVEMMLRDRCPILKRRLFFHDPLFLEQNAILLRESMRLIEQTSDYDVGLVWKNIVRTAQPRTIHTNLDLLEVLSEVETEPKVSRVPSIAVLAHIYYDDMVDEIMQSVVNIPYPYDLYVTTDTVAKKKSIEQALASYDVERVEVRVTEQNLGRDMAALFITLRDVLLSDKYDYACRVHSKKSPQNGYNMALIFKQHMFENLLYTPAYIRNVISLFEHNPTLGMVMPPVVQIAFPTLGHAWFANLEPAKQWAEKFGIGTCFDDATPMAAYGSMFWFRPKAIHRLASYPFTWADFSEHVDGSLSHVLERLVGYAAMSEGYHLRCVINRHWAGINYTKLEFKLQRLASALPNGNIFNQLFWIDRAKSVISNLASASQMDPWSEAATWLDQSKELHERLAEFGPEGDFREQVELLEQARLFHERFQQQFTNLAISKRVELLGEAQSLRSAFKPGATNRGVRDAFSALVLALKVSVAFRFPRFTGALRSVRRLIRGK
jgi:lipopolysaccharide biosynthesis protein